MSPQAQTLSPPGPIRPTLPTRQPSPILEPSRNQERLTAPPQRRGKPLLPLRGVCSLVDRDEDQTLALIEEAKIAWAFDVSLDPKRASKKELRILPAAVADYLRGRDCSLTWQDVLDLMLAPNASAISTKALTDSLNVSNTHVLNLAKQKALRPCSPWRKGPGGSAHFQRQTVIDFLKERRWP